MDGRNVETKYDANQVHKHMEQKEMAGNSIGVHIYVYLAFEATISLTQNFSWSPLIIKLYFTFLQHLNTDEMEFTKIQQLELFYSYIKNIVLNFTFVFFLFFKHLLNHLNINSYTS